MRAINTILFFLLTKRKNTESEWVCVCVCVREIERERERERHTHTHTEIILDSTEIFFGIKPVIFQNIMVPMDILIIILHKSTTYTRSNINMCQYKTLLLQKLYNKIFRGDVRNRDEKMDKDTYYSVNLSIDV